MNYNYVIKMRNSFIMNPTVAIIFNTENQIS